MAVAPQTVVGVFDGRALRVAPGAGLRLGVPLSSSITLRSLSVAGHHTDLGCLSGYHPDNSDLRLWDGCLSCSREHTVRCVMTCVPQWQRAGPGQLEENRRGSMRLGSGLALRFWEKAVFLPVGDW